MHAPQENSPTPSASPNQAIQAVRDLNTFLKSCKDNVNAIRGKDGVTNGREGTVSSKTQESVDILEDGLERFKNNLTELNNTYVPHMKSLLTLATENVHATHHFRHPTATLLEYVQDFGNTMNESLKRMAFWSVYYHTHPKSYYPVPASKIHLSGLPLLRSRKPTNMRAADTDVMRHWAAEYGKARMPDARPLTDAMMYALNDETDPPGSATDNPPAHAVEDDMETLEGRDVDALSDPGDEEVYSESDSDSDSGDIVNTDSAEDHTWRTTSLITRSGRMVAANRRLQGYLFF
ncbi:hypothetical protein Bbelb_020220 [Branchiostoma belcheri]|nr:hypothetical protein Bbelb_020220 [Branchiostoma belcheri]